MVIELHSEPMKQYWKTRAQIWNMFKKEWSYHETDDTKKERKNNRNDFGHDVIIARRFWSLHHNPQQILEFFAKYGLETQKGKEVSFLGGGQKTLEAENEVIQ